MPQLSPTGEGRWIEPMQAYTQEYELYVANLIHQDTTSVIKVVRYGVNCRIPRLLHIPGEARLL